MRIRTLTKLMTTSRLSGANGLVPTATERARGRFMRSPDGHGDAAATGGDAGAGDSGAGGDASGGAEGAAAGDQGGQAGAGAEGAEAGDAGAPETVLGAAAADGDGGESGQGEGDEGQAGEAEGSEEGDEGNGAAFEVLGAPEAYDLTLPAELVEAGMAFDKEAFDLVEPTLREMNLSNEAAQRIVNAYATQVLPLIDKRGGERMDTAAADMRRSWEDAARNDPDIGGAKFDETKALARQTFVRFGVKGDGPFLKLLEESGLGSHPDMIRVMANIGRLTGEAGVDTSSGGGGAPPRLADRVYGKPVPRE